MENLLEIMSITFYIVQAVIAIIFWLTIGLALKLVVVTISIIFNGNKRV